MKRRHFISYVILTLIFLCGCSAYPKTAADGTPWDDTWLTHGNVLGIGTAEEFRLLENYAVLTMNGISTSVWGAGTPEISVSTEGETVEEYPAQIYVLLKECENPQDVQQTLDAWGERLGETWNVLEIRQEAYNGQEYTIRLCESISDTNPYIRELAAFTAYGANAVSVELDCLESFDADAQTVLADFLNVCHYNAALQN